MRKNGVFQWIPCGELEVDQRAQRPPDEAFVNYVQENLDPDLFGVLHVSERDGRKWVVDGNQRRLAVLRLWGPEEKVPCIVRKDLVLESEAKMFVGLNTSRKPRPVDVFLVNVTAGEPIDSDIARLVETSGWTVGHNGFRAVVAARKIYNGIGTRKPRAKYPDVFEWVLQVADAAFGHTQDAVTGDVLYGIGLFRHRYGDVIDTASLVHRLQQQELGALGLLRRGRERRTVFGGTVAFGVAEVVTEFYDRGRRTGKVGPWR